MNALDKTKKVLLGLKKHTIVSCKGCPYDGVEDCVYHLMEEAGNVIAAQKEMMNRKEMTKAKPGFIILTTGIVKESGGVPVWYNTAPIAIRVDDVLMVSDYKSCDFSCGSEVRFKTNPQTVIFVQETLEEILNKILKGEEE